MVHFRILYIQWGGEGKTAAKLLNLHSLRLFLLAPETTGANAYIIVLSNFIMTLSSIFKVGLCADFKSVGIYICVSQKGATPYQSKLDWYVHEP